MHVHHHLSQNMSQKVSSFSFDLPYFRERRRYTLCFLSVSSFISLPYVSLNTTTKLWHDACATQSAVKLSHWHLSLSSSLMHRVYPDSSLDQLIKSILYNLFHHHPCIGAGLELVYEPPLTSPWQFLVASSGLLVILFHQKHRQREGNASSTTHRIVSLSSSSWFYL